MSDCVVCGRETSVSAACPHCARPVCADHRAPDEHGCPGVDADHTRGWRIDLDGHDGPDERPGVGGDRTDAGDDGPRAGPLLALVRPGRGLALLTLALVVVAVAAGAFASGAADSGLNETRVERLVAAGVNDDRRAAGLDPLAYDRDLAAVAAVHSRDMARRGYFDHTAPDGETVGDRYRRFGIDCAGGENIYTTPVGALASSERALAEHVVASLLDSPPHRAAIRSPDFERQGVGVVVSGRQVYVTQNFC